MILLSVTVPQIRESALMSRLSPMTIYESVGIEYGSPEGRNVFDFVIVSEDIYGSDKSVLLM